MRGRKVLSRRSLGGVVFIAAVLAASAMTDAEPAPRLAIRGYDPVAYFTEGKPVPGSTEIAAVWDGTRWQFADQAHRDLFQADPDRYAPQYGGYCALGVARGNKAEVDPEAWTIVDGKLYLNYSKSGREQWRQNEPAYIAQADQNWPKLK